MQEANGSVTRFAKPKGIGLIRVLSNQDLIDQDKQASEARRLQVTPQVSGLSAIITETWQENDLHRRDSGVEDEMIAALQQRDGKYNETKLAEIEKIGGTTIFMGITGLKTRAAEAWLTDVITNDIQRTWSLKPSPIPELPASIEQAIVAKTMGQFGASLASNQQMTPEQVFELASLLRDETEEEILNEAKKRASRMQSKIDDQFTEGEWNEGFEEAIYDLSTLKAMILKGPILTNKDSLNFKKTMYGKKTLAVINKEAKHLWYRVSPLDMYPSDGAVNCDQGRLIERQRLYRTALWDCRTAPGYDRKAIELVLNEYGQGGLRQWTPIDQTRAELERRSTNMGSSTKDLIEAKEFWGQVQGKELIKHEILRDPSGNPVDSISDYHINAIQIGAYIIYLNINPDPLGRRPYSKTGWAKIPGSFWYKGIPELMLDLQQITNAAIRALVNNLGIASGPQVMINDLNRLAKGEVITGMRPWKLWQFNNPAGSQAAPISFFNPNSNAGELMAVFDRFSRLADDFTGIPAYSYGNDQVAGAGRTARGLSMLMTSAARGIRKVISRVDKDILRTAVLRQFTWNMLFLDDESIKGDVEIQPMGGLAMIIKEEMAAQRMEFLRNTADPMSRRIMGVEGLAKVLREVAQALQMKDVVPDEDGVKRLVAEMEQEMQLQKEAAVAGAVGPGVAEQQVA